MRSTCLVVLLMVALCPGLEAEETVSRPNFLIVVLDDIGVTDVGEYSEGTDVPNTPTIDALARRGVMFRNAWSNPVCSPTRATIQTGRYSFRTKVGFIIDDLTWALQPSETTLPELLAMGTNGSYRNAAIGKWHLGNDNVGGNSAPNVAGYEHFAGTLTSINDCCVSYFDWTKVTDGIATNDTTYNTTSTVDEAIAWIRSVRGSPWLCYLPFNAPHFPYHAPPSNLHTVNLNGIPSPGIMPRPYYRAMVEAADTELGRLLNGIRRSLSNTYVIVLGDNGTPAEVLAPPIPKFHGKPSLFEAGINVPLIINGPGVHPGESLGLVNTTDLFATIGELAGVDAQSTVPPGTTLDSVSLVPYLADPTIPSLRDFVFSEIFDPNGPGPFDFSGEAIRDTRYKLLRTTAPPPFDTAFYDLIADPNESVNLLNGGPLPPSQASSFEKLNRLLDNLLASEP